MNTYVGRKAQVLHDLHESVAFLYDNTVSDGPLNAWLDPLRTNEWRVIGWHNVQEMTRSGMPGIFAHGQFDTWSPGYLMFMAAAHNGISRLYEILGNRDSAETADRTLYSVACGDRAHVESTEPAAAARALVAPQQRRLRADGRARLAQLLRAQSATVPRELPRKEQAVDPEGAHRGSRGVRPPGERPSSRCAGRVAGGDAEAGGKQAVEISRAIAPFTVNVPVSRTPSARHGARATVADTAPPPR